MGLEDCHQRLENRGSPLCYGGEKHLKTQSSAVFGKPIQWVEIARYLGVTLGTQLAWSTQVKDVGRKKLKYFPCLAPFLNRRSGVSVRNGVLLYRQLIRPMMDCACPIWRSAARSHVRKLQVLQFKCLHVATNVTDTLLTGKFTRIWRFRSSPTTLKH
jgi:hypothetical protein